MIYIAFLVCNFTIYLKTYLASNPVRDLPKIGHLGSVVPPPSWARACAFQAATARDMWRRWGYMRWGFVEKLKTVSECVTFISNSELLLLGQARDMPGLVWGHPGNVFGQRRDRIGRVPRRPRGFLGQSWDSLGTVPGPSKDCRGGGLWHGLGGVLRWPRDNPGIVLGRSRNGCGVVLGKSQDCYGSPKKVPGFPGAAQ